MIFTAEIGAKGEEVAAEWLLANGFCLLHKNWRDGRYELDIVASRGDTIHFIEVKTRRKSSLTTPQDAITPAKFRALAKAAQAYINMYRIELEPQFDLISVLHEENEFEIEYIPAAMSCRW